MLLIYTYILFGTEKPEKTEKHLYTPPWIDVRCANV